MRKSLNVKKVFDKFGKAVVQQSRSRLTKQNKNATSDLYNSINYDLKVSNKGTSFSFSFEMEDYGEFQDKGVSGIKRKFNTPFKYTNKMPPPKAFDKWVIQKGGKFNKSIRDASGRFKSRSVKSVGFRNSLTFLIARSIYMKGLEPTYFFTDAFETAYKKLPNEFIQKYEI